MIIYERLGAMAVVMAFVLVLLRWDVDPATCLLLVGGAGTCARGVLRSPARRAA